MSSHDSAFPDLTAPEYRADLVFRFEDADGRKRGQRALLTQQLETRFGPLPEPLVERLHTADTDALLLWSKRILTARTLDEVFDDRS